MLIHFAPSFNARVTVEEAAWILRCASHDIPILVSNGLLKPLGHPADNATKFFACDTLQELKHDLKWFPVPPTR